MGKPILKRYELELYEVDENLLRDLNYVEVAVKNAISVGNVNLLELYSYKFPGLGGVSVIALIAESHVAFHSWPEDGFAIIDILTCGEKSTPACMVASFLQSFQPKFVKIYEALLNEAGSSEGYKGKVELRDERQREHLYSLLREKCKSFIQH